MKMTSFIIINFNEIQNILERMKKKTLDNYKYVQLQQIHQVFLSYTTDQTAFNIQRIMAGQITLLAHVL